MNRCTLADVIYQIAGNADDTGLCASNPEGQQRIMDELNVALPLLMKRVDTEGAMWNWALPVCGGCFALPEDCLEGRQIFVNGFGTIQRDKYWQGTLAMGQNQCGTQCCWPEIVDLGDYPTPQPLPNFRPIYLSVMAESNADATKEVQVEIVDQYGKRWKEVLALKTDMQQTQMEIPAVDVTFFGKPITEAEVRLYANFANGQRFHIASYGPKTQVGQFRRKKLPSWCAQVNLIRVFGKLRLRKITSLTDILPICDTAALSWALSAVSAMRSKDTTGYNERLTLAVNELFRELENADSPSNVHPVQFMLGASCGGSQAAYGRDFC